MPRLRWNESIWDRAQRVALWLLGAAGIVNELFLQPQPRPMAYPIIAALLGLPFAQAFDRARSERSSSSEDEPARPRKRRPPSTQSDPGARP